MKGLHRNQELRMTIDYLAKRDSNDHLDIGIKITNELVN